MAPATAVAAAGLLLGSAFVAAWWLIGDLSYRGPSEGGLDYVFESPDISDAITTLGGLAGLALAAIALWTLVVRGNARGPAVILVAAGVLASLIARMITAGVIGANIGGALAMLFGAPAVALAVLASLWAVARAARVQRT